MIKTCYGQYENACPQAKRSDKMNDTFHHYGNNKSVVGREMLQTADTPAVEPAPANVVADKQADDYQQPPAN